MIQLDTKSVPHVCAVCDKTSDKMKRCAQCHIARYCSQNCQAQAWPTHKKVCRKPKDPLDEKIQQACQLGTGKKDFAIHDLCKEELLPKGEYKRAVDLVTKEVKLHPVKDEFVKHLCNAMLKDTAQIEPAYTYAAQLLLIPLHARQRVVEGLIENDHFQAACVYVQKHAETEKERSFLFQIIGASLMLKKRFQEAREVILTIPDQGIRKDELQILQNFEKRNS